jgi:hypothetical protein
MYPRLKLHIKIKMLCCAYFVPLCVCVCVCGGGGGWRIFCFYFLLHVLGAMMCVLMYTLHCYTVTFFFLSLLRWWVRRLFFRKAYCHTDGMHIMAILYEYMVLMPWLVWWPQVVNRCGTMSMFYMFYILFKMFICDTPCKCGYMLQYTYFIEYDV